MSEPSQTELDFSGPPPPSRARSDCARCEHPVSFHDRDGCVLCSCHEYSARSVDVMDLADFDPRRLARRTDPDGSHEAARQQVDTGRAAADSERVATAVLEVPGLTSKQYSEAFGLDRHMVARRLPDLERAGRVQRSEQPGQQVRWFPRSASA